MMPKIALTALLLGSCSMHYAMEQTEQSERVDYVLIPYGEPISNATFSDGKVVDGQKILLDKSGAGKSNDHFFA